MLLGSKKILAAAVGSSAACVGSLLCSSSSHCDAHLEATGVPAFSATYAANDPSEDRSVVACLKLPPVDAAVGAAALRDVKMVGVFDGHGGWQVSNFVVSNVVDVVTRHLGLLEGKMDEQSVSCALRGSYAELEGRYKEGVRQSYAYGFGAVAKVGCCALVCVRVGDRLSFANAGDCRAVVGSATADGGDDFRAVRITRDHNAREPMEVLRLMSEHPGESQSSLIRCKNPHACYVKGRLQLTRALGDAYLKYPDYNAPPGQHRDRGRHIPAPYTPPYVGAVPQIHHLTLQTKRDRFLVLASDGVWDYLSDQDAVDVVSRARRDGVCPATAIKTAALTKAAQECGLTLPELLQFPPGRQRRGRHDDTTAVVLDL